MDCKDVDVDVDVFVVMGLLGRSTADVILIEAGLVTTHRHHVSPFPVVIEGYLT